MDANEPLSQFTISTPCPMDWDRMPGDDRTRFCAACGRHVYNLTAMSPEATASLASVIREHGERRCVRVYQRPDGTLVASKYQPALHGGAKAWQFTIRSLMAVIAGCAALLGLAKWLSPGLTPPKPPPPANFQIITGDMY